MRMNNGRVAWCIVCAAFLPAAWSLGATADLNRVHKGVRQVESGGNPHAYCAAEDAAGELQIRPCVVADCNRIVGRRAFTLADRYDPAKSKQMFVVYLTFYGKRYTAATHRLPTSEVYARMWNGGPAGWKKTATVGYWKRVSAAMNRR